MYYNRIFTSVLGLKYESPIMQIYSVLLERNASVYKHSRFFTLSTCLQTCFTDMLDEFLYDFKQIGNF